MVKGYFTGKKRIVIIIFISSIVIFATFYWMFFSMHHLPEGKYLSSSLSPNKEYKINVYLSSPSLSANSVRCEVENIESGKKRNIYWEYRKSTAEIEWVSEKIVSINGREINVLNEHYDFRKDKDFE